MLNNKEYQRKHYRDNLEWRKKYAKKYRKENRDRLKRQQAEWYRRQKAKWNEILVSRGFGACARCGYNKCFAAIEYHHNRDKDIVIGHQLSKKPTHKRVNKVLAELAKCTPLCANCHREIHHMEAELYAE